MIHRVRFVPNDCYTHSHTCVVPSSPPQFWMESAARTAAPFAMSYLSMECGFPPKGAVAAAAVKHVRLRTAGESNACVEFLLNLGFTDSDIPKILTRNARLLVSDPEKHLQPRIGFLQSQVGISPSDATQVLQRVPENDILHANVENRVLRNLEFIREVVRSEDKAIHAIRRYPALLTCDPEKYLIPSIKLLRESGVGESSIIYLLACNPWTILTPLSQLSEVIERVKKMGINPKLRTFAIAIHAIRSMTKETWERKMDAYKKWGWSEEVTLKAFTKSPWCIMQSEKKIMENMDYYVNKMGFDALDIAGCPLLLEFSLKKRIVPRDAVLSVLLSKGLIKSKRLFNSFIMTNQLFRDKYVKPYKKEAPELSELFESKISENGGSV